MSQLAERCGAELSGDGGVLIDRVATLDAADKGAIAVNGKKVNLRSPQEANAGGIGIVHQEQSLFTNLSVA